MSYGLDSSAIQKIKDVFSEYPKLKQAILYGSRALGTYNNGSDIDLTFTGKGLTLEVINKIETQLDDLLLPYTFDISIYGQIKNESLLNHIERVGVVFYKVKSEAALDSARDGEFGYRSSKDIWRNQGNAVSAKNNFFRLGDVCENLDSKRIPITKSKRVPGKIPYYGASGIVDYVADSIFEEDLLLVSEDGANLLARTYPIAFSISGKTWVNNHAHTLRFKERTSQEFIEYYLNSISLAPFVSGMAQPKLNQKSLNSIQVPFPPLPEQKRIVGILDKAFDGISQAVANAEKNLTNARELFESYLNSIFTQKGDGWVEKDFSEVCKITSKLIDPKAPEYFDLKHIGAANIVSSSKELVGVKTAREENLISGKFYFTTEMVLYSKIRPYLMKVAAPDFAGICSADIYPLVPKNKILNKDFLFYILLSKRFTEFAIQGSPRAGMPKVNRKTLFSYKAFYPDLNTQIEFVEKLNLLHHKTQQLETLYQQKLTALAELKQSILQKTFSGELT